MDVRKLVSDALGTAFLVFFGVGVATLSFGFKTTGSSVAAGVVATALTFGSVMLVLAYGLGPISGAHINPAVTIGFLLAGRITIVDAAAIGLPRSLEPSPAQPCYAACSPGPRATAPPRWGWVPTGTGTTRWWD